MIEVRLRFIYSLIILIGFGCEKFATNAEVCTTTECKTAAELMSTYMNFDAKACDNFYDYVCGNQKNNEMMLPGENKMNILEAVFNEIKKLIISTLEKESPKDSPKTFEKAKQFYAQCMDTEQLENVGLLPVSVLLKILNLPTKPPFIGNLEDNSFNLGALIGRTTLYAEIEFPFHIQIDVDPNDKIYNTVIIKTPSPESNSKIIDENDTNAEQNQMKTQNTTANNKSSTMTKKGNENQTTSVRGLEDDDKTEDGKKVTPKKKTDDTSKGATDPKKPLPSRPLNRRPSAIKRPQNSQADQKGVQTVSLPDKVQNQKKLENTVASEKSEKNTDKVEENNETANQETKKLELLPKNQAKMKKADEQPKETTVSISDKENIALTEYMIEVANILYKYTNNQLIENKKDILSSAIGQVSQVLHAIEKLVENFDGKKKESAELTLKELQQKTDSFGRSPSGNPVINWSELFNELLQQFPDLRHQFENGRKIHIEDMNYYENVIKLLSNADERVLYSAVWWNVVRNFSQYTIPKMRELENNYRQQVGMKTESRQEFCMKTTISIFSYAAGYSILKNSRTQALYNELADVFQKIYIPLRTLVENNKLLDKKTKMAATQKLMSTGYVVGYPSIFEKPKELDEAYAGSVNLMEGNFFFSFLYITQLETRLIIERMMQPNDKSSPKYIHPLDKEIKHYYQNNAIQVPIIELASLQPYLATKLGYLKYGTLGFIMSREEFHSVDSKGNEYNAWGRKRRWWEESTTKNYFEEAKCYVESYNSFKFPGLVKGIDGVDGQRTLEENIADSVGFKNTIKTYKRIMKGHKDELNKEADLPGFETFSNLQVLTIAWANRLCQIETTTELKNQLTKSEYAPPSVRIQGVVKNSAEFAAIWNCKKNSKMNPEKKCILW